MNVKMGITFRKTDSGASLAKDAMRSNAWLKVCGFSEAEVLIRQTQLNYNAGGANLSSNRPTHSVESRWGRDLAFPKRVCYYMSSLKGEVTNLDLGSYRINTCHE